MTCFSKLPSTFPVNRVGKKTVFEICLQLFGHGANCFWVFTPKILAGMSKLFSTCSWRKLGGIFCEEILKNYIFFFILWVKVFQTLSETFSRIVTDAFYISRKTIQEKGKFFGWKFHDIWKFPDIEQIISYIEQMISSSWSNMPLTCPGNILQEIFFSKTIWKAVFLPALEPKMSSRILKTAFYVFRKLFWGKISILKKSIHSFFQT